MASGTSRIFGQRLGKIGLARTGRTDEQDVRLLQFDFVPNSPGVDSLVVVVDRNGERFFRALLTDHILVEDVIDFFRLRNVPQPQVLVNVLIELSSMISLQSSMHSSQM